jgi:hypothetical protein
MTYQYQHETEWVMPESYPNLSGEHLIAIDLETKDPDLKELGAGWATGSGHIIGIAVAVEGASWYFPIRHANGGNLDAKMTLNWLRDVCGMPDCTYVFHNAMYDVGWLKREGIIIAGRIVDTIARLDLTDDTVIVFTSDHGDVFGDHGLILKHFTHYDAAIRVPLIISGAGIGAGTHRELASSTDIAPTLLDLAGTTPMAGVQGASLVPIMNGDAVEWRSAILVEEDQPYGLPTLPGPVRLRTVITDALRYTRIAGTAISELYDLRADPLEMSNRAEADSAGELRETANAVMVDELMRVVDDSKVPFHAA